MAQNIGWSLFGGFFQFGYVTRDLDAAVAAFRKRYNPVEFVINVPGAGPDGSPAPTRRIGLTYIDDVMVELIEPETSMKTIYDHAIPQKDGDLQIHHFGYLIDDHKETLKNLAAAGYEVPMAGSIPGFLDYSYADTRAELGHFSEFIRLHDHGRAFFDSVPRHKSGR